jgi:hypothetical protein
LAIELVDDGLDMVAGVERQVGLLRKALPQQPVDASMSSRGLVDGDVVAP